MVLKQMVIINVNSKINSKVHILLSSTFDVS